MKQRFIFPLLFAATILQAQARKDYAVFFPVTTYTGGWTQLPATLTECNDLANDLQTLYGFETTVLPDKTKAGIKTQLAELANRSYGPNDQLLLVFSMHGYFDEAGEAGCLCPAGAKANDGAFDTWLLHTELRTLVARIPCEHILVILDACYSGTFGGKKGKPDGEIYKETPDCQANIQQALSRKTPLLHRRRRQRTRPRRLRNWSKECA
ncbi:MAG: caspase family protein [Lewinellaceae bacterium]|nr:caspase family protein [Lewinellaceae bacterium]